MIIGVVAVVVEAVAVVVVGKTVSFFACVRKGQEMIRVR